MTKDGEGSLREAGKALCLCLHTQVISQTFLSTCYNTRFALGMCTRMATRKKRTLRAGQTRSTEEEEGHLAQASEREFHKGVNFDLGLRECH